MRFINTDNDDILAFVRTKNKNKVFAVFNLSPNQNNVDLKDQLIKGSYSNLFDDKKKSDFTNEMKLQMEPWSYRVYIK